MQADIQWDRRKGFAEKSIEIHVDCWAMQNKQIFHNLSYGQYWLVVLTQCSVLGFKGAARVVRQTRDWTVISLETPPMLFIFCRSFSFPQILFQRHKSIVISPETPPQARGRAGSHRREERASRRGGKTQRFRSLSCSLVVELRISKLAGRTWNTDGGEGASDLQ